MDINADDYKILNLNKDPFSTAPDPEFLYQSRQHFGTLQLLESSIKKEEGICIVLGVPGTGKTSICRQLYRKAAFEKRINPKILYAHYYENSDQLLGEIADLFNFKSLKRPDNLYDLLIGRFNEDSKTISLIIDNGHIIPDYCLNVLNRLNDLESKGRKFFQIVIFANKELTLSIEGNPDFESRIAHYRTLGPFNFRDTRQMILHRLKMAGNISGMAKNTQQRKIFSFPAMLAIYMATKGDPRKIVLLCHRCIVSMLLKKTLKAGWFMVRASARRVLQGNALSPEVLISASMIALPLLTIFIAVCLLYMDDLSVLLLRSDTMVTSFDKMPAEHPGTFDNEIGISDIEMSDIEKFNRGDLILHHDRLLYGENFEKSDTELHQDMLTGDKKTVTSLKINDESLTTVSEPDISASEAPNDADSSFLGFMIMPETIGTVEVKRADTLLVMLERVYGHSRSRFREAVVSANRHLSNINALEIGDMIHFPPVIVELPDKKPENFWIRVSVQSSLAKAVDFYRSWPRKGERIKIIPYFSKKDGLHFDIILRKLFSDSAEANDYQGKKNLNKSFNTEIIRLPVKSATFFSNPYLL